jgi:hypothetical protein
MSIVGIANSWVLSVQVGKAISEALHRFISLVLSQIVTVVSTDDVRQILVAFILHSIGSFESSLSDAMNVTTCDLESY